MFSLVAHNESVSTRTANNYIMLTKNNLYGNSTNTRQ